MCERWVGDEQRLQHIDPHLFLLLQHFFPILLGCLTGGHWGPQAPIWELVLTALNCNNKLQTPRTSCGTRLYNCLTATYFSECHICTGFKPSTVEVIPWYLWPDAPVIYTGAFLIWQFGRVGGQYVALISVSLGKSPSE